MSDSLSNRTPNDTSGSFSNGYEKRTYTNAAAMEMRAELERAADTFADFARVNDLMARAPMAEAARIAEASVRALLAKIDGA